MASRDCPILPLLDENTIMQVHKGLLSKLVEAVRYDGVEHENQVMKIVEKLPAKGLEKFFYRLLLVILCSETVNYHIVEKILKVCPNVAQRNDEKMMLPLHLMVIRDDFDVKVVSMLVKLYPQGLCETNIYGDTPLHIFLSQSHPDTALLTVMLKACPKAIRVPTMAGKLPLHLAVNAFANQNKNVDHIKHLVQAMPEAVVAEAVDDILNLDLTTNVSRRTVVKWTPLSRAMESHNTVLINAMTSALHMRAIHRIQKLHLHKGQH